MGVGDSLETEASASLLNSLGSGGASSRKDKLSDLLTSKQSRTESLSAFEELRRERSTARMRAGGDSVFPLCCELCFLPII